MKMTKYFFTGFLLISGAFALYGQNIELPDVTTVISGETVKAGTDALPDFEDLLVIPEDSGNVIPQLPDVDTPSSSEALPEPSSQAEKTIFAEGLIGGGYPSLFTGDFSVFRLSGLSPFKIHFSHDSANGYGNHSLSEGFNDRTTNLSVEKSFEKVLQSNQINWGFAASYQALSNGLQNHLPGITNLNQDDYAGKASFSWLFANGFSLGLNAGVNLYSRYADDSTGTFETVSVLNLNPDLFFNWAGYGFKAGLTANYDFEKDLENLIIGQNAQEILAAHRGKFGANLEWANDFIKVYGDVYALVGNTLNENDVIVPFFLGLDLSFPVYFSNRKFSISAQGGLDSYMNKISDLERKYKFTTLTQLPQETSDWFGKIDFSVPLKESFTGNLSVEYRQTAFDNGYWQPVYSNQTAAIYSYELKNLQQLNSQISLSYHYKIFSVTGGWNVFWMDLPAMEDACQLVLDLNFQSQNSSWGADLKTIYSLDSDDKDPIINFEAFARLTSALRAVISVEDSLKLIKGQTRLYAGNYITRGGRASLLLKFFF